MAEITTLAVADAAELWRELGFVVADGACWVSGIRHQLGAPGHGIVGWTLTDADGLGELPLTPGGPLEVLPTPDHPNGVTALDHIVVTTPDLSRTTGAFASAGIVLRRLRDAGSPERPMTQAFFTMGGTTVEVVAFGAPHPGPARFYGLAFTVADLDATAAFLGPRLRSSREAVQSGRRIATLDRSTGSTVALAFMSPKVPSVS